MNFSVNDTAVVLPVVTTLPVVGHANKSGLDKLVSDVVEVLNDGPSANPQLAMTLAVATPIVIVALCMVALAWRVLSPNSCWGCCGYWRRMPKEPRGLEPDQAIGEHQDEHVEIDSDEEESREDRATPVYEDDVQDVDLNDAGDRNGHRECCSKMAAVLETGALGDEGCSAPTSPQSTPSGDGDGTSTRKNGKAKMVTIQAP
jgi:hypothetical protein